MTSYLIRSSVLGIAAFFALIFIPAGTFQYWQGWVYVATWIMVGTAYTVYAAGNVRVEEGQKVISTGMYGFVRHPMYFGTLFLLVGTPIALGSWWSLLVVPVFIPILVVRILNEEKVLARDLPGYVEYMQKVRYRLVRHIW